MGGYGGSNRFSLVGSRGPLSPTFAKDVHSLVFSEVIEFALSLTPAVKGQESYLGLPYLQAYRFIRAMSLAEMGNINLAQRLVLLACFPHFFPYFVFGPPDTVTLSWHLLRVHHLISLQPSWNS